jgi:hypothetical protein
MKLDRTGILKTEFSNTFDPQRDLILKRNQTEEKEEG